MNPTLRFQVSSIYIQHWAEYFEGVVGLPQEKYPTYEEINEKSVEIKSLWNEEGRDVFRQLEEITNLKWQSKEIQCYLVGRSIPFSSPLTMPIYFKGSNEFKPKRFFDTLVHELIHIILTDNSIRPLQLELLKPFKEEYLSTLVHAIHKEFYLLNDDKRGLAFDIENSQTLSSVYARSWEIVEKIGYQNIINHIKS